jgi:hypothetical protein
LRTEWLEAYTPRLGSGLADLHGRALLQGIMGRIAALLAAFIAMAASAVAHPAVGIVIDRAGTVFYSDTAHVWAVARGGAPRIVVRDVHTHDLWLDANGALYGEHLVYDGGRWSHRVWKRTAAGAVSDVIAARQGFLSDYRDFGFQRDARGAFYWMEGATPSRLRVKRGASQPETLAELPFTNPSWMTVRADGTVFVSENGTAWRVRPGGAAEQLPAALCRNRERLAIMGMAALADGTTYFAVHGDRAVRRLSTEGTVETIETSPPGWAPSGVAVSPDGAIWVLEVKPDNRQRARRVGAGVRRK